MKTGRVQSQVAAIEQRLEHVERRLKALEGVAVDLTLLKSLVGDLKFEIEQMQEA